MSFFGTGGGGGDSSWGGIGGGSSAADGGDDGGAGASSTGAAASGQGATGGQSRSSTAQASSSGGGILSGFFSHPDPANLKPNDVAEALGALVVTREENPDSRHVSDLQPGTIFRVTSTGANNRVQIKAEPGTGGPAIEGWTSTRAPDGQGIVKRVKESDAATKLLKPYQPGGRCEVKAASQARREKSHNSAVSGTFQAGEALQIVDKQGTEVLLQSDKVVGWVTGVTAEGGLALAPVGTDAKYGSGSGIMGTLSSWTGGFTKAEDVPVSKDVLMTGGGTPKGLANSSQDPFLSASGRSGGVAPQASANTGRDPFLSATGRSGGAAPQAQANASLDPFLSRGANAGSGNPNQGTTRVNADPFLVDGAPAAPAGRSAKAVRVDFDPLLDRGASLEVPADHRQHTEANPFLTSAAVEHSTKEPLELNNDPFLSHAPVPRTLANDPFNTQTRRTEPRPIAEDPFLSQQMPCATDLDPKMLQEDPFLTSQIPYKKDRIPLDVSEDPLLKEVGQQNVPRELQNDPFLTHARKNPGKDKDPFLVRDLVHEAPRYTENVARDPFLASHREIPKENKARKCCRHCGASARRSAGFCGTQAGNCWTFFLSGQWLSGPKRACGFCGEEVDAVEPDMVLRPWLIFMAVLFFGLVLRHYTLIGYLFLVLILAAGPAAFCFAGFAGARSVNPLMVKSSLVTLLAVLLAARAASFGWNFYARQYWWMQTGLPLDGEEFTKASTPPMSRGDASWIRFPDRNSTTEMRQSDTQVDVTRSAGYRDGKMYCVAPILSSAVVTSNPLIPVNYWAIGTDCCELSGSFTCDGAQPHDGQYGVVMLGQLPCFDCELSRFRDAIQKAEALHGMAGSSEALMVRYVADPYATRTALGWRLVRLVVVLALTSFLAFTALGIALRGARWQHLYGGVTSGMAASMRAIKAHKAAVLP